MSSTRPILTGIGSARGVNALYMHVLYTCGSFPYASLGKSRAMPPWHGVSRATLFHVKQMATTPYPVWDRGSFGTAFAELDHRRDSERRRTPAIPHRVIHREEEERKRGVPHERACIGMVLAAVLALENDHEIGVKQRESPFWDWRNGYSDTRISALTNSGRCACANPRRWRWG